MIGDPSGRSTERSALPREAVRHNAGRISDNLRRIFDNHLTHFWINKGHKDPLKPIKCVDEYSNSETLGDHLRLSGW